jgi:hypothetical protein
VSNPNVPDRVTEYRRELVDPPVKAGANRCDAERGVEARDPAVDEREHRRREEHDGYEAKLDTAAGKIPQATATEQCSEWRKVGQREHEPDRTRQDRHRAGDRKCHPDPAG